MATRLKRQCTECEKIFSISIFDKELIRRIYRDLKQINFQRIDDPMKKWATE
jgi:hypothetical protein